MEGKQKRHQPEENDSPSPLILKMTAENWGYSTKRDLEFKDKDNNPLECQVSNIILEMCQTANEMLIEEVLSERKYKREQKERQRQWVLEQMRKGQPEEMKLLDRAASDWSKAKSIREFTDNMGIIVKDVLDADKQKKLLEWIKWARCKADWIDPLIAKEDELLGESKHIFNEIIKSKDRL